MIFVNSMSDLFHESVPLEYIQRVFETMRRTSQHTYQILTKRAARLEQLEDAIDWPTNVWMGVSVESSDYRFRIDHLRRTGARIKFLSLEPLLGPIGPFGAKRNRLGHCWGRRVGLARDRSIQTGCGRFETSVLAPRGYVSLQAVGRSEQEKDRAPAGWTNLGSIPVDRCGNPLTGAAACFP